MEEKAQKKEKENMSACINSNTNLYLDILERKIIKNKTKYLKLTKNACRQ